MKKRQRVPQFDFYFYTYDVKMLVWLIFCLYNLELNSVGKVQGLHEKERYIFSVNIERFMWLVMMAGAYCMIQDSVQNPN